MTEQPHEEKSEPEQTTERKAKNSKKLALIFPGAIVAMIIILAVLMALD